MLTIVLALLLTWLLLPLPLAVTVGRAIRAGHGMVGFATPFGVDDHPGVR